MWYPTTPHRLLNRLLAEPLRGFCKQVVGGFDSPLALPDVRGPFRSSTRASVASVPFGEPPSPHDASPRACRPPVPEKTALTLLFWDGLPVRDLNSVDTTTSTPPTYRGRLMPLNDALGHHPADIDILHAFAEVGVWCRLQAKPVPCGLTLDRCPSGQFGTRSDELFRLSHQEHPRSCNVKATIGHHDRVTIVVLLTIDHIP